MKKLTGLALLPLLFAAAACEEGDVSGDLVFGVRAESLAGLWTGQERIFGSRGDLATASGTSSGDGFSFQVALTLAQNHTFVLRTFNFPTTPTLNGNAICRGVWQDKGQTLQFFPDDACLPLPLSSYTIGRSAPSGLTLSAETQRAGATEAAVIRVLLMLERDAGTTVIVD